MVKSKYLYGLMDNTRLKNARNIASGSQPKLLHLISKGYFKALNVQTARVYFIQNVKPKSNRLMRETNSIFREFFIVLLPIKKMNENP